MTDSLEIVVIPSGPNSRTDLERARAALKLADQPNAKYVVSGIGPDLWIALRYLHPKRQEAIDLDEWKIGLAGLDVHPELWNYILDNTSEGEIFCIDTDSKDTVGNVLNSIGDLDRFVERTGFDLTNKGWYSFIRHNKCNGYNISIVSGDSHLRRFKHIIDEGKEEGLIKKDLTIEYIDTGRESLGEKIYGCLAKIKERIKIRNRLSKYKEN